MSQTESYKVTCAVAVSLLAAQLLLLLHTAVRQRCLLTTARAAVQKFRAASCFFFGASVTGAASLSSEIEEAVQAKVLASQLSVFRKACLASTVAGVFNVAHIAYSSFSNTERFYTLGQDIASFVLMAVFMLRQCKPDLLNSSSMNVWYSVVMGLATFVVAPGLCTSEWLSANVQSITTWVSVISIGRLNARWVTPWYGAFTVSLLLSYFFSDFDGRVQFYSAYQAVGQYGIIVLCIGWIGKSLEVVIRSEMEASTLEGKVSAGNALLKIFYEVVLELNTSLQITSPGELGGFLQSGAEHSFQGTRLQDLLPSQEDQERFAEHMRSTPTEDESLAKVMHLMMEDGAGQALEVELFSFQFKCPTGRSRHLIGLREFSNDMLPMEASSAEQAATLSIPLPGVEAPSRGPLWLQVELMEEPVPVTECSPALQRLLGLQGGSTSLHALTSSALELVQWVERIVNQQIEGVPEGMEEAVNSATVTLRQRNQSKARIQATCQVELSTVRPFREDDDGRMTLPVVLLFQDAERVPVVRRSRGEEGSGGGSNFSGDSQRLGTPRHAANQHIGKLPSEAMAGRVQRL